LSDFSIRTKRKDFDARSLWCKGNRQGPRGRRYYYFPHKEGLKGDDRSVRGKLAGRKRQGEYRKGEVSFCGKEKQVILQGDEPYSQKKQPRHRDEKSRESEGLEGK